MGNLARVLGGLSTAAGRGFEGFGQDRQIAVRDALAQRKLKGDEERDRVLNALAGAQTNRINNPSPERPELVTAIGPNNTRIRALDAPGVEVPGGGDPLRKIVGHQIAQDGTPYNVYNDGVWEKANIGGAAVAPSAAAPDASPSADVPAPAVAAARPDTNPPRAMRPTAAAPAPKFGTPKAPVAGTPEWEAVKRKEAEIAQEVGAAKLTEPQEKSYLFYNLMEKAQPQIDAAMGSKKVRKLAVSAYLNAPSGVPQALANGALNTEEQSLIRSFRDFAAGVLRKESGAAVTPDELREVWGRYGPGFGDEPETDAEKSQGRINYMNTMRDQALPAIEYYAKRKGAPGGAGNGGGAGGGKTEEQKLWDDAVRVHGREKVLQSYGPRP